MRKKSAIKDFIETEIKSKMPVNVISYYISMEYERKLIIDAYLAGLNDGINTAQSQYPKYLSEIDYYNQNIENEFNDEKHK